MPGSPRDNTDALLRELRDLRREVERLKRHRHPIGRNEAAPSTGAFLGLDGIVMQRMNDQSINSGSNTVVTYDTVIYEQGTAVLQDGDDLDIQDDGTYWIIAQDAYDYHAGGTLRQLTVVGAGGGLEDNRSPVFESGFQTYVNINMIVSCEGPTPCGVRAFHNAGAAINLGFNVSAFGILRIGDAAAFS